MLYFLYGTDTTKARAKLHELLDTLQKKKPDAALFRVESEQWNDAQFEEFLGGQGLFSQKYIVVLDRVFENAEAKATVVGKLKEIADSDNVFMFIEPVVDAASLKKIEKHAQKTQEFEEKKSAGAAGAGAFGGGSGSGAPFNIFSLTDAFGTRDKKKLWVLYQQALASGSQPEEIHGILFWQLKSMILAAESGSAAESGLKPFVYQKSKGFAARFSRDELRSLSGAFIDIYHNARRGISEMDVALEKFILSI